MTTLCRAAITRQSILTFDELKSLFAVIKAEGNKRDRALFLTAYRHGLRASEVGRLHKADIDFKQLRIY
jgi:integrase